MNWLAGRTIALSVSPPEDLAQRGMGPEHFNDALGEVTRQLLALGAKLVYGGDLRSGGITRMLFELAARYYPPSIRNADYEPAIIDVIPYYAHAELSSEDISAWEAEFAGIGRLLFMRPDGDGAWDAHERPRDLPPASRDEWADSLAAMREYVTRSTDARIVVGGRMSGYLGRAPGVIEEANASLSRRKPLFVVGGFGGAAGVIARSLVGGEHDRHEGRGSPYRVFTGLERREFVRLATSPHIDEIVVLIVRGLRNVFERREPEHLG